MKISACMIAKNEEKNIVRALQSLGGIADEIIVVDTGSQDQTAALAKRNNAKVYSYAWQDDFAAARNFALAQASGDWVVFLDADEYFTAGCGEKIRAILAQADRACEGFLVQLINIDADKDNKEIDRFYNLRICRNLPEFSYVGKIHEQLRKLLTEELKLAIIAPTEAFIYHSGYSTALLTVKAQRNLAMLLPEYEQTAQPELFYAYLAEAYLGIGEYAKALEYAKLDIAQGRRAITYASRSCRILLQTMQKLHKPCQEIKAAICTARQLFPEMPEFMAEYGVCCFNELDYAAAIAALEASLALKANYAALEPTLFDAAMELLARQTLTNWRIINNNVKNLKISACVITKNEAANIGRWLANMKLCSDEQIVMDTGSDDATVAIAKQGGAKVYRQQWNDDFAQAKNAALAKATGDWVIFLDADEYFSAATVNNVRKIIAREQPRRAEVDVIMCTLVNIDCDQNNLEINRFKSLRLLRREPYLKFCGNIHESVRHTGCELCVFTENEHLEIYHTGYSSGIVEQKLKRNLALLQADIAVNGEGKQHYRYLLDCYHGLGEHEKAIYYAKLHLASDANSVGTESDIYRNLINSMVLIKKAPAEIAPYIETALQRFSDIPDFYAYYAGNLFRQGQKLAAKPYLLKALEIYNAPARQSLTSSSFAAILSETYSYLGEIYKLEHNRSAAEHFILLSLDKNRYNQQAFAQLYELYQSAEPQGLISILEDLYQATKLDYSFILTQLDQYSDAAIYLYFAQLQESKFHEVSAATTRYRLFASQAYNELFALCLQDGVSALQTLCIGLLLAADERLYCKQQDRLPQSLQRIITRYYNAAARLVDSDADAYKSLLNIVMAANNANLLSRYQKLSGDFSAEIQTQIFMLLCQNECYDTAAQCLTEELYGLNQDDAQFLYYAGIASYQQRQWSMAKNYFAAARQLGSTNNDISSYMQWIKEQDL